MVKDNKHYTDDLDMLPDDLSDEELDNIIIDLDDSDTVKEYTVQRTLISALRDELSKPAEDRRKLSFEYHNKHYLGIPMLEDTESNSVLFKYDNKLKLFKLSEIKVL